MTWGGRPPSRRWRRPWRTAAADVPGGPAGHHGGGPRRRGPVRPVGTVCQRPADPAACPGTTCGSWWRACARARLRGCAADGALSARPRWRARSRRRRPGQGLAGTEALMRQTYELFEDYAELAPKMLTGRCCINVLAQRRPGLYCGLYRPEHRPCANRTSRPVLEELDPLAPPGACCTDLLAREMRDPAPRAGDPEQGPGADGPRTSGTTILREQMKVIQAELGESEDGDSEIEDYRKKIAEAAAAGARCGRSWRRKLSRLAKQPFGSAEATRDPQLSGRMPGAALGQEDQGAGQRGGGPEGPGQGPLSAWRR